MWWDDMIKALAHKYIRRTRKGNRWHYVYADDRHGSSHKVAAADVHKFAHEGGVGDAIHAGAGKGHLVISKVDGDTVHFHHDDVDGAGTHGETMTMNRAALHEHLKATHSDAIERHTQAGLERRQQVLARAREIAPDAPATKRAAKELARWKDAHGIKDPPKAEPKAKKPRKPKNAP